MLSSEKTNSERRRFPRASFREPVSFRFSDQEDQGGCLAKDISEGGLRIYFENFVRPQTPMMFELRLPDKAQAVSLQGSVAWSHRMPASDRYQLGIDFMHHDDDQKRILRRFVMSNPKI